MSQSVARGERLLLAAEDRAGAIVGTVQVILDQPENQPHRGDIGDLLLDIDFSFANKRRCVFSRQPKRGIRINEAGELEVLVPRHFGGDFLKRRWRFSRGCGFGGRLASRFVDKALRAIERGHDPNEPNHESCARIFSAVRSMPARSAILGCQGKRTSSPLRRGSSSPSMARSPGAGWGRTAR